MNFTYVMNSLSYDIDDVYKICKTNIPERDTQYVIGEIKREMIEHISKYIGIIHLCGMIIENSYGFIIIKNVFFDKLYIISFVSIPFSWIICKNECIISYIIKKIENPNYILGNEPENVKDISDLFINERQYMIFYNINTLLRLWSVMIVNKRTTNINNSILIPTFVLYLYYNYDITYKRNYTNNFYPYFQIILCVYLFTIFYKTISI